MRLWHYELIPYLPKSQLLAQWRELNSIFKKQDKHILINYIYDYPKSDLLLYTHLVTKEMESRGFKINPTNYENYFDKFDVYGVIFNKNECIPFKNHHTYRYLMQCFYNLQEKYDRGQKDFSKELYCELEDFMFEKDMLF